MPREGFISGFRCFLFFLLLSSCQPSAKYHHSIFDFEKTYQGYLTDIVSINIVGYDSATQFIRKKMTDKELFRLSYSEHPVLRAVALRELTNRKSVNQLEIILQHLDDTATVFYDRGEWGIQYRTVADDMLNENRWVDSAERLLVIDKVIMEHSRLKSAYQIINKEKLTERYYSVIREMTKIDWPPDDMQTALFALASYRKAQDIPYIREKLLQGKLTQDGLYIIAQNPDTSYFYILERYFHHMYRDVNNERSLIGATAYFNAVAAYKNDRSAAILTRISHRHPIFPTFTDTSEFKSELNEAILNNRCPAYSKLVSEMKSYILMKKRDSAMSISVDIPIDTTRIKRVIVW